MVADKAKKVSVKGQSGQPTEDGKGDIEESNNQKTANQESEPETSYWTRYVQHRIHFMSF